MTNNDRFDAALRAHVFHRPFLEGEAAGGDQAEDRAGEAPAAPSPPNFASELEASLVRDLNALATGLRPRPKKLLPERIPESAPEPPPAAAEAKPANPYTPLSKLPPAAWPAAAPNAPPSEVAHASEKPLSPYAPQPKRPLPAPPPAVTAIHLEKVPDAGTSADPVKPVSRYAPPKRPGYLSMGGRQPAEISPEPPSRPTEVKAARLPPANGISPVPDKGAVATDLLGDVGPATRPLSPPLLGADEATEEPNDSRSPEELAKLYAPVPTVTVAPAPLPDAPETRTAKPISPCAPKRVQRRVTAAPGSTDLRSSDFAPRPGHTAAQGGDGSKLRPIRWQASDEAPSGPILPPPRGGNWTGKAAVVLVLIGLIGGGGAVVTLESLSAPEPGPGTAAAHRPPAEVVAADKAAAVKKNAPTRTLTVAARVPASSVEVIHADDAGNGLAPAEGSPLPGSAEVIPLPQPVRPANDPGLRPSRDAAGSGDIGPPAGTNTKVAALASPTNGAMPAGAAGAGNEPAIEASDVPVDGGDSPAGPPPRAPTPRPAHDGASPDGLLAYAPAADPIDHIAKAFAKKNDGKPEAKAALSSGSARVTAWVNMRASADNKAATVKVLPTGSMVTVVQCKFWCEIVADGKRGFVYKSFLKATGDTASAQ